MDSSGPELSIVIPAYNEAGRIAATLVRIVEYCEQEAPDYEILVIDDGSRDDTVTVAKSAAPAGSPVRVIELSRNRGKGAAVRRGMLAARGRLVLFSDADLATPIEELAKLRSQIAAGCDIAIGSRAIAGADIRARQHPVREFMGRTFNVLVRLLALSRFKDTQCGFKLFTAAAARDLFSRAVVDGFAFDVEILLLARGRYNVVDVPVIWRHVEESRVSPGIDAGRMLLDVIRMRLRGL